MNFITRSPMLFILCLITSQLFATVIYVKPTGDDTNNGLSWATAKQTVSAGIAAAASGDQLWVAAGTYIEHLTLNTNVSLYGGFNGTETQLNQRNFRAYETILDGSLNGTILIITNNTSTAITISGFTVKNGYAQNGGGIKNSGSLIIMNNVFQSNLGYVGGGSIENDAGYITIANNFFIGNGGTTGSGIGVIAGTANIFNNTFEGNNGTAVYNRDSVITLSNNIIAFNDAGILHENTGTIISSHNCVYGNSTFNYSGISSGSTDINQDPQLAGILFGNIHILPTSPCIDSGDNSTVTSDQIDIDGQLRIQGSLVDIGADESDGSTPAVTYSIVRVSTTGNDLNDGSSWAAAKKTIQSAINLAYLTGGEVWVKGGIYQEEIQLALFVHVFGGFNGTETLKSQRNWSFNKTILEGLLNGTTIVNANSSCGYGETTLDGFTIRHHTGSFRASVSLGYCGPNIYNNTITQNSKEGIEGFEVLSLRLITLFQITLAQEFKYMNITH